MPNTELFMLSREDRVKSLKSMEFERLLAELDDTIQFDILGMSNEKWITFKEKKVYLDIISELREQYNTKPKEDKYVKNVMKYNSESKCKKQKCIFFDEIAEYAINGCTFGCSLEDEESDRACKQLGEINYE